MGIKIEFKPAFDSAFESAFKPAFRQGFTEIWSGNLEPAFNELHEKIDIIQTKLDKAFIETWKNWETA